MQNFFNKIKPSGFFIFAAILFGIIHTCLRPPMQAPDELNHFCRAYQISEGKFLPEDTNRRLGGQIPVCIDEFNFLYVQSTYVPNYKIGKKEMLEGFEIPFSDKEKKFMDFPNTAYYSLVSYIPQSFALLILRQFNCSVGTLYFGSKLFSYLSWMLCMFFVIRCIPIYKWLFTLLMLLPMHLYISNCHSADVVTNILCFLLIALVFRRSFDDRKFSRLDFALFLLLGVLLAFTKIVYVAMLILLLIIPSEKFGSKKGKITALGLIFLISFIVTYLWSGFVMQYYVPFDEYHPGVRQYSTLHPESNYYKQKEHLLQNKFHFFKVMFNSVFCDKGFYLRSYIGRFGTFMDSQIPFWLFITSFCVIIFVSITEYTKVTLSYFNKLMLFLAAMATYFLLLLSQHLTWNRVGSDIVSAFQGRYLIPIFPLLFMLFNNRWKWIRINSSAIVVAFVLFSNVYCCKILYKRYMKEIFTSKVDIYCDAEETTKDGSLKTSDPAVVFSGGEQRTTKEHRSGKYAIMLAPDSSRSFTYKFKNLGEGDLVEIYVWQKGTGAEINVKGSGEGCEPYSHFNNVVQTTDKNGWRKLKTISSTLTNCRSSEGEFYIFNPTHEVIYIDDIRYVIKKFKK